MLHLKTGLFVYMDELGKVTRAMGKALPGSPHEVLLVELSGLGRRPVRCHRSAPLRKTEHQIHIGRQVQLTGTELTQGDDDHLLRVPGFRACRGSPLTRQPGVQPGQRLVDENVGKQGTARGGRRIR